MPHPSIAPAGRAHQGRTGSRRTSLTLVANVPQAAARARNAGATANRDVLDLHIALTDLIRVYRFHDRDAVCCHGVSPAQSHALDRLARHGSLSMNQLAAALYLEKSSASRLADGLAAKGYVVRQAHSGDARAVALVLTRRGRAIHARIERDLLAERRRVLAHLRPRERRAVVRAIESLSASAARRVETQGGTCHRIGAPSPLAASLETGT